MTTRTRKHAIFSLLPCFVILLTSAAAQGCNIYVKNNACFPITFGVRYLDANEDRQDVWKTKGEWTFPPGRVRPLYDEGECLDATGSNMHYWAESEYFGSITASTSGTDDRSHWEYLKKHKKNVLMTPFFDTGRDFDLTLEMHDYGSYEDGTCTNEDPYIVNHLSIAAAMAENNIIDTFSCSGTGSRVLKLNTGAVQRYSAQCALQKCRKNYGDNCRIHANEVYDHRFGLGAVVARSTSIHNQSVKNASSEVDTRTNTQKRGFTIGGRAGGSQEKGPYAGLSGQYDNTTTQQQQQQKSDQVEGGSVYHQNVFAISDVFSRGIEGEVFGFCPQGNRGMLAAERDHIACRPEFRYVDYKPQMKVLRACAAKGGTRCRIYRVYATGVDHVEVLDIEKILVAAFSNFSGGTLEDVRFLLTQGASVSAIPRGVPVLHHALVRGGIQLVSLVLDHMKRTGNGDINVQDDAGYTALHIVAEQRKNALAKVLLDAGASPNITNKIGKTALNLAAEARDHAMMKTLLKGGADPNVVPNEGAPVLHELVNFTQMNGDFRAMKALMKWNSDKYEVDFDLEDASGNKPHEMLIANCLHSGDVWNRLRAWAGNDGLTTPKRIRGWECGGGGGVTLCGGRIETVVERLSARGW